MYELFCRDPAYFQRMLEFFLHSRFRMVRLSFQPGKRAKEAVFFSIEGQLINVENNKVRFPTLTAWYNDYMKTTHSILSLEHFKEIHISTKHSIYHILKSISHRELEEFIDLKYRSSVAYLYVTRCMRNKRIACDWNKTASFIVEWEGNTYTVTRNTVNASVHVGPFLDAICDTEHTMYGLYLKQGSSVTLLTEEKLLEEPEEPEVCEPSKLVFDPLLPTPPAVESLEAMKQEIRQELHKQLRTEIRAEIRAEIHADLMTLFHTVQHMQANIQTLFQIVTPPRPIQ